MITQDRDAGTRDRANGRLIVLDLLVAPLQPHHRLVIEMGRNVFDGFKLEASRFNLLHQRANVPLFPTGIPGQRRIVHLNTSGTNLAGEP
jgi:hypothetical protein